MDFETDLTKVLFQKLPESGLLILKPKSLMTTLLGSVVLFSCFLPLDIPAASSSALAASRPHRTAIYKKKNYGCKKTVYRGKKTVKKKVSVSTQKPLSSLPELKTIQPEDFVKPNRAVDTVYVHHTGVGDDKYDKPETIRNSHRAKGWDDAGYNFHIARDGTITTLRNLEWIPAAQKGHNVGTIAIVYQGVTEDDVTDAQEKSLRALCAAINMSYGGNILFRGHKEAQYLKPYYSMNNTACPAINYTKLLELDENHHMPLKLSSWQRISSCPPVDRWQSVNGETCAPEWWLKAHPLAKKESPEIKRPANDEPLFDFSMEIKAAPRPPSPPMPSSPAGIEQQFMPFLPPVWWRRRKDGTAAPELGL